VASILGRFLEIGLASPDPQESWQHFQHLGFAQAVAGDVWPHAYGVVSCENLALGLHAGGAEPLTLYFVRENVRALHRELSVFGFDIEQANLAADAFNELQLRDPTGVALRVLEARSFSPAAETPRLTALGHFRALSLPCHDLEEVAEFWSRLGASLSECHSPWPGVQLDHDAPLAYHARSDFAEAALLFDGAGAVDVHRLQQAGLVPARPLPSLRERAHRLLRGAEGLAMVVLG
jgi:hypothetical protein